MPYCHKCGSEVKEDDTFCPQCGTKLNAKAPPPPPQPAAPYRTEKGEKEEKNEKNEKQQKMEKGEHHEKYEKQAYNVFGPLIGGIILIIIGFALYLAVTGAINFSSFFPIVLIIIGAIVILGVIVGAVTANKRNPTP
jgi:uncharacterized membrane protein YvbJ